MMSKKGTLKKNVWRHYLPYVLLLLFFQGQFDEDLLQLLVTVIDDELLEAVVLRGEKRRRPHKPCRQLSHGSDTQASQSTRNTHTHTSSRRFHRGPAHTGVHAAGTREMAHESGG